MPERSLPDFTLAAVVTDLDRASDAEEADAIEFRMDGARDPLDQLATYDGSLPIIATNRARWEGGDAPDDGRLATLADAISTPAVAAVDVELQSVREGSADDVRDRALENDVTVIVSAHDFEATPARASMAETLDAAAGWGDIGKLAVTAEAVDDVLDLLTVTRDRTRAGQAVATMSMGAVGRHSRVIAPLYGSRIGYAPIELEEASAHGQLPLGRMVQLLDALGV